MLASRFNRLKQGHGHGREQCRQSDVAGVINFGHGWDIGICVQGVISVGNGVGVTVGNKDGSGATWGAMGGDGGSGCTKWNWQAHRRRATKRMRFM